MEYDLCVIGGFGHVGLPLSVAFANSGKKVCAFDIAKERIRGISGGRMPFLEHDGDRELKKALESKRLHLSSDPEVISKSENIIVVTGTPTDEHLSPDFVVVQNVLLGYMKYFIDGQLLVLRSTVYPGTTDRVYKLLKDNGKSMDVAFCPERIVEGYALKELYELPQIVSATTPEGLKRVKSLFSLLTKDLLEVSTKEAEIAKLFTNSWRYIRFSVANQFFMIANEAGLDYTKIYNAMRHNYPRAKDLPGPGFASGPCLFKDTVQLSAFNNHSFHIGNAAISVNEGLPFYVVNKLKEKYNLREKNIGILGMAFKAGSDDKRDSLSYKLKSIIEFESNKVYCTDVHIKEDGFVEPEELIEKSDIIIVATPHKEYADLKISGNKVLVDIWGLFGRGFII